MQPFSSLPEIIIDKIHQEGPLSFRDFMEMALYHPVFGYYTSERSKIGEEGDFYTSAYLTGLFGELLANQLEEMWVTMGRPRFTVVEYGAGTGLLCRDILCRLRERREFYTTLNYYIIEKSGAMREKEKAILTEKGLLCDKVGWVDSIGAIGPVTGCIFSNELVDNFSVHRVVMQDKLMEVCVGYDQGFKDVLRPAPAELNDYLLRLGVDLPRGYRTEINLEATQWIQDVAGALERGYVLTIDYGYPSSVLYAKKSGTLACYHQHRVHYRPYERIGEQDITSHVNFSALDHWGRNRGLDFCGYTSQTHFLQGLGLTRMLRQWEENGGIGDGRLGQLRTFLLEMGHKFKVLIQRKGVGRTFLSGLQFCQVLE